MVEPNYPAAVDRYVNLGEFYNVDALKYCAQQVIDHTKKYKEAYSNAYHCLAAKDQIEENVRAIMRSVAAMDKAERRIKNIVMREFKHGSGSGKVSRRFLGGITHMGYVWRTDTIDALCTDVYELQDPYGYGSDILALLLKEIVKRNYDCLCFVNPDNPKYLDGIIVQEVGVGFIRTNEQLRCDKRNHTIRLQALVNAENTKQSRARRKLLTRVADILGEEAIVNLKNAKEEHDLLESVYHPYVNFDGVMELARRESRRMLDRA